MPTGRPLGLISTLIAAGSTPLPGVMVIHSVPSGAIAVLNTATVAPALTESVSAAGSAAPVTQVNDNAAGTGVSVVKVWPAAGSARNKQASKREFTWLSSTKKRNIAPPGES
ncbi:MAG: hypothetical protein ABSF12_05000 [Bryobacteraceae bacterium]